MSFEPYAGNDIVHRVTFPRLGGGNGGGDTPAVYDDFRVTLVHHATNNNDATLSSVYTAAASGRYLILCGLAGTDAVSPSISVAKGDTAIDLYTIAIATNMKAYAAVVALEENESVSFTGSGGGYGKGFFFSVIKCETENAINTAELVDSVHYTSGTTKSPIEYTAGSAAYYMAMYVARGEHGSDWDTKEKNGEAVLSSDFFGKSNATGWAQNVGFCSFGCVKNDVLKTCGGGFVSGDIQGNFILKLMEV